MKRILSIVLGFASLSLFGYEISVDTVVVNPGQRVAVPVRVDSVKGAVNVGVRVAYDPQVLVFMKAQEGSLTKILADDYVVVGDEKNGSVFVAAFGGEDVEADAGGTLTTLIFAVREGTAGLYSDLAVTDVKVGEKTGVKDLSIDNPVRTRGGMVRVMSTTASVARLEYEQIVGADATLGAVAFQAGDGIQASGNQTPIVVTGEVTAEGAINVMPPVDGWTSGRYELLKTGAEGLSLTLVEAPEGAVSASETTGGVTTYFVEVAIEGEIEVVCESETLSAAAKAKIRQSLEAAGNPLVGVKRVVANGPAGSIALIADLGIAPSVNGPVDVNGILNVSYSMPTLAITAFDPQTGAVRIRVVPGEGDTIVSELATGYVHVYGTSSLAEQMKRITKVGFDLTPYLKMETRGEAVLLVELGAYSFLKVKVEDTPGAATGAE